MSHQILYNLQFILYIYRQRIDKGKRWRAFGYYRVKIARGRSSTITVPLVVVTMVALTMVAVTLEANKIAYGAKSIVLDNGAELTYCELGEQNEEVLVTGAFYFHTVMPIVEFLAERYHVYGVVMCFDGATDELNPDGSTNWTRQWGADVYRFAKALGLEKFRYFGKCHGAIPGWYIVKEHPEMLTAFASFYLAPHVLGQNSNKWFEMADSGDVSAMMAAALRKPKSGLKKKMAELAALGDLSDVSEFEEYAACPEKIWDSTEDARDALLNVDVPVGYMFANDDPVFRDYYDSNIWAIMNTRRARTVILNGEKHLMELDSPERVANEVFKFFDEARQDYFDEDEDTPEIADAAVSDEPDEGLRRKLDHIIQRTDGRAENAS